MDKNTYETLPTTSTETSPEQFFLLQDDGTFLINKLQYVTQVQDTKEELDGVQSCTIYDVTTPQQFFVDVDNSAELISVPENFILPNDGSNMYTNNYLLQTVSSTSTDQMEEDISVDEYKQSDVQAEEIDIIEVNGENKDSSNCTEITLSDEQYNMLEQKGWVLLNINDKIFILDTLGLHDITSNEGLIQQLKTKTQINDNLEIEPTYTTIDSGLTDIKNISTQNIDMVNSDGDLSSTKNISTQDINMVNSDGGLSDIKNISTQNIDMLNSDGGVSDIKNISTQNIDMMNSDGGVSAIKNISIQNIDMVNSDDKPPKTVENTSVNDITCNKTEEHNVQHVKTQDLHDGEIEHSHDKVKIPKEDYITRIKTQYVFKDIPEKIILGKTVNGKKLVAKVVKPNKIEPIIHQLPKLTMKPKRLKHGKQVHSNDKQLHEWQLDKLVQQTMIGDPAVMCKTEHITACNEIIMQLMQVPALQHTVSNHFLFVTKVVKNKFEDFCSESVMPSIVAGRVMAEKFIYLPDLLEQLVTPEKSQRSENAMSEDTQYYDGILTDYVLHVHVTEVKAEKSRERVFITLNKKPLPLHGWDGKKRQHKKIYACGSCATIFKSENELTQHQETHCMDTEDTLTIDTDDNPFDDVKLKKYYVLKTEKGTLYVCLQCSAKFRNLSNCQRHIKTHSRPVSRVQREDSDDNNVDKQTDADKYEGPIYKCKICSSKYFHPSTLSKHIVTTHINIKGNSN